MAVAAGHGSCSSGGGQTAELQLKAAPTRKESAFAEAFPKSCLGPLFPRPPKKDPQKDWLSAALSLS